MPRMVDLNVTTYWWIPQNTITNVDAISAATLTSAANISTSVVATTRVGATSSDTVSEKAITDVANAQVPTVGNYEGTLVVFRDMTAGVPTASQDILFKIAKTAGVGGWVVRRTGMASTAAAASGQLVDAFLFLTDNPQSSAGSGEGYLKATIPLLPQGIFRTEVALVA